jgi:hypothetical protein
VLGRCEVSCRTLVEHIPAKTCFKPQYASEPDRISAYGTSLLHIIRRIDRGPIRRQSRFSSILAEGINLVRPARD